jgi:hypothetical protein
MFIACFVRPSTPIQLIETHKHTFIHVLTQFVSLGIIINIVLILEKQSNPQFLAAEIHGFEGLVEKKKITFN